MSVSMSTLLLHPDVLQPKQPTSAVLPQQLALFYLFLISYIACVIDYVLTC